MTSLMRMQEIGAGVHLVERFFLVGDGMAKELSDTTMRENAAGPAEVSGDSGSMKQHSLRDQIGD